MRLDREPEVRLVQGQPLARLRRRGRRHVRVALAAEGLGPGLGLNSIVTLQYSSTTLYYVSYHNYN